MHQKKLLENHPANGSVESGKWSVQFAGTNVLICKFSGYITKAIVIEAVAELEACGKRATIRYFVPDCLDVVGFDASIFEPSKALMRWFKAVHGERMLGVIARPGVRLFGIAAAAAVGVPLSVFATYPDAEKYLHEHGLKHIRLKR